MGEKDKADLELIIAASNLGSEVCYNQQVLRDITSERYQQKASPTCIYDMLANVCARQVRMLNTEPEKRVVLVDSNLATHIVSNGVSNAAKYGSNEKKPTLAFQLIEKQNENTCELVVVIESKKVEQHLALQAACDEDGRINFTEDHSAALPRASKSSVLNDFAQVCRLYHHSHPHSHSHLTLVCNITVTVTMTVLSL